MRYKTALLIACIGMIVAPLGVFTAHHLPSFILQITLTLTLVWISVQSWKLSMQEPSDNTRLPDIACMINPATSKLFWTASCTKRLSLTGIISGFLSGLLGVGGGFIIVPSLNKVTNFTHQSVITTTLAAVSLITLSGIISHLQTTHIIWTIAIPFALSTTVSMLIISEKFSAKLSKNIKQKAFSVLCLTAAIYLAAKQII